jgi:ethanolamine utilization protein EutS
VSIGFLDRFTGSVVISGDVQSVEISLQAVSDFLARTLNFTVCDVTVS